MYIKEMFKLKSDTEEELNETTFVVTSEIEQILIPLRPSCEKYNLTGLYCCMLTVEMNVNVLLTLSDDHGGEEEEIADQLRTQLVN